MYSSRFYSLCTYVYDSLIITWTWNSYNELMFGVNAIPVLIKLIYLITVIKETHSFAISYDGITKGDKDPLKLYWTSGLQK